MTPFAEYQRREVLLSYRQQNRCDNRDQVGFQRPCGRIPVIRPPHFHCRRHRVGRHKHRNEHRQSNAVFFLGIWQSNSRSSLIVLCFLMGDNHIQTIHAAPQKYDYQTLWFAGSSLGLSDTAIQSYRNQHSYRAKPLSRDAKKPRTHPGKFYACNITKCTKQPSDHTGDRPFLIRSLVKDA